jgi:hypothetical protein
MPPKGVKLSPEHRLKIIQERLSRPQPPTKSCSRCKTVYPREHFGIRRNNPRWARSWCKNCESIKAKEWAASHPEGVKRNNRASAIRRMRVTPEEFDRLNTEQKGVCRICGRPNENGKRLFIDHDHETGKVRGLTCDRCNTGLGMFRDNPILLEAAAAYLRIFITA